MDLSHCVFHLRSPSNAAADALFPLSALAESDPDAHAKALEKYTDTPERARLPETIIPILDALWTEVVFLSPVLPHAIHRAWKDIAGTELAPQPFWAIPVDDVPVAVMLDRTTTRTGDPLDPREVTPFDPSTYQALTRTTERSRAWITELAAAGRRGAFFHGTPHVLTRGPVPLRRAQLVDWSVPIDDGTAGDGAGA